MTLYNNGNELKRLPSRCIKNAESPLFPSYMQNQHSITYKPQLETKDEPGRKVL